MRDFLNIFNSRIITLFFHSWLANRYDVALELHRHGIYENEDPFSMILFSLCGMGLPSTRGQRLFPDDVFASSAGHIARPIRSASSIQRCLQSQFGVDVDVVEFVEERLHLPVGIRTRIGVRDGAHNVLGSSAVVGDTVPAFRQRFEVRVGPLDRQSFELLCPFDDGEQATVSRNFMFRRLVEMTRSILGRPLDFDIRLTVKPEAVEPARLGHSRLGFDSWICSEPEKNCRIDTVKRFKWDMEDIQNAG
jgi:type VI secretion system protein ImpH